MKQYLHKITIVVIYTVFIITGCTKIPENESLSVSGMYFDTVIQIEAWGTSKDIMDGCLELCSYYENKFSASIDTSEISLINQAAGKPVQVSPETAELLRLGIEYGDLTEGRFDITIASASSLWDFTDNKEKILPDADTLENAVKHINYKYIKIDGNTITLSDPEARIDLGGIAKGYIADRLKDYLTDNGVEHALINLGGNMLAVGNRYDNNNFRIGIQQPFEETGTVLGAVSVSDLSVVTSGNYERYFEKEGVIYHHILDPDTGYPVQNDLDQVTVISEQSVDGDALSTACYTLGLEKGMDLIRKLDDVEAIFVTRDGAVFKSSENINFETVN